MSRLTPLVTALALGACHATPRPTTPAVTLAIVGATVVHPGRETSSAEPGATVLVAGDRIVAVGPGLAVPPRATVVHAEGKWVIPGLIDSHVHFFQSGNPYTRPDVFDLTRFVPYAKEDARNRARLPATFKVWLACGVTSVFDVGGPFWNFEVRDAARASDAAPRVKVAGPLISMVARLQLDNGDPPIIQVKTPAEAQALATRELARRPDLVKVWFIHRPGDDIAKQEAICRAAGETAHAAGVRLAVHATELATAKAALRAGADVLVHSVFGEPIDDDFLALARKNHAIYVPTLFVMEGYRQAATNTWRATPEEERLADPQVLAAMPEVARIAEVMPPALAARVRGLGPGPAQATLDNLRKVWAAGLTVAMGTDAGNVGTLHGPSIFREMALMARAGLTPGQVLWSATAGGARMLRMERDLGDVAPGKIADLVILDADPLADVASLSRAYRVVKGGHVFDPAELMRSIR